MTFAEREQIAAATENCRKLAEAVAALTKRVNDLEDAATRPAPVLKAGQFAGTAIITRSGTAA